MLSLYVIGNVSLFINSSHNKSPAGSPAILLGEKSEVKLVLLYLEGLNICIPIDTGDLEGGILSVFEVFKHVVVKSKVLNVVCAVGVSQQDVLADARGEVVVTHGLGHVGLYGLG
jgi:hypothetical protein